MIVRKVGTSGTKGVGGGICGGLGVGFEDDVVEAVRLLVLRLVCIEGRSELCKRERVEEGEGKMPRRCRGRMTG